MNPKRLGAIAGLVAAVALSACGPATTTAPPPTVSAGAPASALLVHPDLPALSVRTVGHGGAQRQRIVYPNATDLAGENYQVITVRRSATGRTLDQLTGQLDPAARIRLSEIRERLASDFPDVQMTLSDRIGQSPDGPYGYAHSPAGRPVTCVLAWQAVPAPAGFPSDVRDLRRIMRLCATDAGVAELLETFEGFRPAAGAPAHDGLMSR